MELVARRADGQKCARVESRVECVITDFLLVIAVRRTRLHCRPVQIAGRLRKSRTKAYSIEVVPLHDTEVWFLRSSFRGICGRESHQPEPVGLTVGVVGVRI
jgi:hypothetical protein